MVEKIGAVETNMCLERRQLKVALAKAMEKGADVDDVSRADSRSKTNTLFKQAASSRGL